MNKTTKSKVKNAEPSSITLTEKETKKLFLLFCEQIGDLIDDNFDLQNDNEDLEIKNEKLSDANLHLSTLVLKYQRKYRNQLVSSLILTTILIGFALYVLISMHIL